MQDYYWIVEIRTATGWMDRPCVTFRARSEQRHISGHSRIRKFIAA